MIVQLLALLGIVAIVYHEARRRQRQNALIDALRRNPERRLP